ADVAGDARDVGEALAVAHSRYESRIAGVYPLPRWLPTPGNRRLLRAVARLDEVVYRFIAQRREGDAGRHDLLSLLLRARDEEGGQMTDQQLRDEAMTLFLAGHETTALALTWTGYLLAQHPEAHGRLLEELRSVLGGRAPSAADLPRLAFTEHV